jgi:hypothetical protein
MFEVHIRSSWHCLAIELHSVLLHRTLGVMNGGSRKILLLQSKRNKKFMPKNIRGHDGERIFLFNNFISINLQEQALESSRQAREKEWSTFIQVCFEKNWFSLGQIFGWRFSAKLTKILCSQSYYF